MYYSFTDIKSSFRKLSRPTRTENQTQTYEKMIQEGIQALKEVHMAKSKKARKQPPKNPQKEAAEKHRQEKIERFSSELEKLRAEQGKLDEQIRNCKLREKQFYSSFNPQNPSTAAKSASSGIATRYFLQRARLNKRGLQHRIAKLEKLLAAVSEKPRKVSRRELPSWDDIRPMPVGGDFQVEMDIPEEDEPWFDDE